MREEVKKLNRWNELELKVYRALGVRTFRNLLFKIEKLKHRKDGNQNKNYHLQGTSIYAIDRFRAYLLYNCFLHCMSILFTVLYFVFKKAFHLRWSAIDVVMYFVIVLNIYCIILQRYNYLRIKKAGLKYYIENRKTIVRRREVILKAIPCDYDYKEMMQDAKVLSDMKACIENERDYYVGQEEARSFERMSKLLKHENVLVTYAECDVDQNIGEMISRGIRTPRMYTKLEQKVSKRPCFAIITYDSECEKAFHDMFPNDSLEKIMQTIEVLEEVFRYQRNGQDAYENNLL